MIAQSLTLTASSHGKDRLVNLPPLNYEREIEREMDETIRRSLRGQSFTLSAVDLAPANEEDDRARARSRGTAMTPEEVQAEIDATVAGWFKAAGFKNEKNQKQKASPDMLLSGDGGQRAKAEADAAAIFAEVESNLKQHRINH